MVASPIVEGFSLSHAQILDGATSFLDAVAEAASAEEDIYGVNDGSLSPDTDNYDNEGDDVILSRWDWLNYAEIEVQAGYLSFPLIANMTGRALSSSGSGDDMLFETDLWHEDSMNVAPKPALLTLPSKDKNGKVRRLTFGLYRVQFQPITFDGPSYKDGLKVNYNGTALYSPSDEMGQDFADGRKRVGKLLSHV